MANVSPRVKRVADQLQRELASLIQQEISDPRVGMVSVTGVEVSRDLAYATVFVTVMGSIEGVAAREGVPEKGTLDALEIEESVKALNKASGFLRSLLAKQMSLRTIPRLTFKYDSSIAHGQYLSSLIENAIAADEQREQRETDHDLGHDESPKEDRE